jgi:hypothetical protein
MIEEIRGIPGCCSKRRLRTLKKSSGSRLFNARHFPVPPRRPILIGGSLPRQESPLQQICQGPTRQILFQYSAPAHLKQDELS